jgi:F-type H+-transporting ATPase subunit b
MPSPPVAESGGGSFLVSPSLGLMIWTLIAFFVTMFILRRYALPEIQKALDKRQRAIEDSIDASERTRVEADRLLSEYRERLKDARQQAEEIVTRARAAGDVHEQDSLAEAKRKREEMMEDTRRDIEQETKRAIQQIRNEVADLTVLATEKVTRKTLNEDDQRRLVEEALGELDFESLAGSSSAGQEAK